MVEIRDLKDKIQQLINKTNRDNEGQKRLLNFLFEKLKEVKEVELIERIKDNEKWLNAYLFYKSITRTNWQPEHLKISNIENVDKLLELIEADVDYNTKAKEESEKINWQPTNEELLIMLGERMGTGEIKSEYIDDESANLYIGENGINKELSLDLNNGEITSNKAQKLLKKHGFKMEVNNIDSEGRQKAGIAILPKGTRINLGTTDYTDKDIESVKYPRGVYEAFLQRQYKGGEFDFDAVVFNGRWLLKQLSRKIKSKEIDREWNGVILPWSGSSAGTSEGGSKYLFYKDDKGTVKLHLWNGKLTEKNLTNDDKAEAVIEAIGEDEFKKNKEKNNGKNNGN